MKMDYKNSLTKNLMLVAILFALLAVFTGSPYKITIQPVNINEEFEIEGKSVKVIDVKRLAEWLMDKRSNFYLIDSRVKTEYEKYHMPFAINSSIEELLNKSTDKKTAIVIYDSNSRYSTEKLIRLVGNRAEQIYVLMGGMNEWINKILFPDLQENNNLKEEEIKKIYRTSTYFGGKPILSKDRPKKKYKREGC